jgi:hypothetical protein
MTVQKQKQCKVCKQFKPKAEFKRRLTLAQTRAVLKQPNATTRYEADSKRCKACQKLLKRTKPLTSKEIRSKITSGDMHPIKGEMKLERIRQAIPLGRSKVMKEYWDSKKTITPYKQLKRLLQDQVNRYGNRHFASKNLQDATQTQNSWNYQEARRIMKDLLEQAQGQVKAGTNVPSYINIATLIKPRGEAS